MDTFRVEQVSVYDSNEYDLVSIMFFEITDQLADFESVRYSVDEYDISVALTVVFVAFVMAVRTSTDRSRTNSPLSETSMAILSLFQLVL